MNARTEKILAIQFRSLGDAVLMIPSLQAIRNHFPNCVLHALVSESAAPLLQRLPFLDRIWAMPRTRGRTRLKQSWPFVRALRAEKFDRSVDFSGNDRGAILSLLCGARLRLGLATNGFFGKKICFTQRIAPAPLDRHEAFRTLHVLSAWDIALPDFLEAKINSDPALGSFAEKQLPEKTIICHMGAGMAKKQWPVRHWATFYKMAATAGFKLAFTAGENAREQLFASELKRLVPDAQILPWFGVAEFLAVLKRAQALITGDTGPMHFAAALNVPFVALFGASNLRQWRPLAKNCEILESPPCVCDRASHVCHNATHCLAAILPEQVFDSLKKVLCSQRIPPMFQKAI